MKKRLINSVLILLGFLAFGAGLGLYTSDYYAGHSVAKPEIRGFLWPNPREVGDFELVDHGGKPFQQKDLIGKWSLLFFGFTHCPDVCPTTLSKLNQLYTQLQKDNQADKLQVLFVTVDPKRDTSEALSQYVNYFNKDFIGLGGNKEQVDKISKQLGIVSVRTEGSSPENYSMDHSASVLIIDPEGRWVGILSAPHEVTDMTERYLAIKKFISQES